MSNVWLGAIASLSGVIVGAVATYLTQVLLWKRVTRRELYGSFVGRSNVCRERFLDVAWGIRQKIPANERNERWEKANAQMAEVSSLGAQIGMVATIKTCSAAEELERILSDLRTDLYRNNRDGTTPKGAEEVRQAYGAALKAFTAAAGKELGTVRSEKRMPKIIR